MTVRVGINGFGRIGRNFFRAAKRARRRHRLRRGERPRLARHDGAPAEVRLGARRAARQRSRPPRRHLVDGDELRVLQRARPEGAAVGRPRRRRRHRVDRLLHQRATRPRSTSRAARRSSSCRRRRDGADATFVYGVNHKDFDPQAAPGHLQRELHHELLRAAGEGARRRVRRREGLMTDRPRLHRRPAARRRPAQRPAPGPRRGDQHRAHQHRRGPCHEPRARVDEGQARRHVAPRAGAHRVRSPTSPPT